MANRSTTAPGAAAAALLLLLPAFAARADVGAPEADRVYWAIAAGGFGSLLGVGDWGPAAQVEIYPGLGRFGLRAQYTGIEGTRDHLVTAGLAYVSGSNRPHIHLALHADAAVAFGDLETQAGAGGGLQVQLWIKYPLAVGVDTTAHVLVGDGASLHLATVLTARLSF